MFLFTWLLPSWVTSDVSLNLHRLRGSAVFSQPRKGFSALHHNRQGPKPCTAKWTPPVSSGENLEFPPIFLPGSAHPHFLNCGFRPGPCQPKTVLAPQQPSSSTTPSAHTPSSCSQRLGAPCPALNLPQAPRQPGRVLSSLSEPTIPLLAAPTWGTVPPQLLPGCRLALHLPTETSQVQVAPFGLTWPFGASPQHGTHASPLRVLLGWVSGSMSSIGPSQTWLPAAHSVTLDSPSGGAGWHQTQYKCGNWDVARLKWWPACLCLGSGLGWFSCRELVMGM